MYNAFMLYCFIFYLPQATSKHAMAGFEAAEWTIVYILLDTLRSAQT